METLPTTPFGIDSFPSASLGPKNSPLLEEGGVVGGKRTSVFFACFVLIRLIPSVNEELLISQTAAGLNR